MAKNVRLQIFNFTTLVNPNILADKILQRFAQMSSIFNTNA